MKLKIKNNFRKNLNMYLENICNNLNLYIEYVSNICEINNQKLKNNNLICDGLFTCINYENNFIPISIKIRKNAKFQVYILAHELGHYYSIKNKNDNSENSANKIGFDLCNTFLKIQNIKSRKIRKYIRKEIYFHTLNYINNKSIKNNTLLI